MGCTTDVGLLLVVRLVAILGGMVVRRMAEGLSLMAPEKHDWNGSSRRTEPTSAGRVGFFGAIGTFRAGHGSHGVSGGGQGCRGGGNVVCCLSSTAIFSCPWHLQSNTSGSHNGPCVSPQRLSFRSYRPCGRCSWGRVSIGFLHRSFWWL